MWKQLLVRALDCKYFLLSDETYSNLLRTCAQSNRDIHSTVLDPDSSFFCCRHLFKDASGTLDKNARFSPLYRQDSNKLSNDDMLKLLIDFRKLVMLLSVPCIHGLSSLTDVLEKTVWKICSYTLYLPVLKISCLLTSVNVVIYYLFLFMSRLPACFLFCRS